MPLRSVLLAAALALAAAVPAAAADGFMSVQDFQFAPAALQLQPGEKVDFNFEGPSEHTATLGPRQTDRYDSGPTGPGFTKSHRFLHPGRFELLCTIHPEMRARVVVGTPESERPTLSRLAARPGVRKVRLGFRLSERAVVTVRVGSKRIRRVLRPGRRSIAVGRLGPGRRTASLRATDGWGNRSSAARRSFTVR